VERPSGEDKRKEVAASKRQHGAGCSNQKEAFGQTSKESVGAELQLQKLEFPASELSFSISL
jgi:hypothetical protein